MLNKKSLLLSLILGLMFGSVSVFASNLTERNVYGVLSENFTGALQETGHDVDNVRFNCWADWEHGAAGEPTSKLKTDGTAKEGKSFVRITALQKGSGGGGGWSGCSYTFVQSDNETANENVDISHFKYLDFWIRKVEGNINELQVGVTAGGQDKVLSLSNANVDGGTGNGVNNNSTNWQHVVIDITALSSALSSTKNPFLVLCNNLTVKTIFDVDNIVLRTDSSSADFKITLKKVEDMQGAPENPTQITWLDSVFQDSWQAACQYIEIDPDKCSYAWTIRMYTNNNAKGRNGLWASSGGKDYVIPMCFRVYNGRLYNFIESPVGDASFLIGQSKVYPYNLYDRGVNPDSDPGVYTWLWMKEYKDIDFNDPEDVESITVFDSTRGYHEAYPFHWVNGSNSGDTDGFKMFDKVDKKLRVYFGAGFDSAAGGLDYTANIVINVNYE